MSTRLFLVCLHLLVSQIAASCPYIRTSVILAECVFDTSLYISLGAQIINSNSVDFLGYYSLGQPNSTDDHLRNTLIYNLGNRWMFLVPFLIKCAHQPPHLTFTECQYTMRQTHRALSASEYMTTHLSVINITDLGLQSVLFLQPGEITLRSCKAYDCNQELVYLTASNETFHFQIDYEKTIGTQCEHDDDCHDSYTDRNLLRCDQTTRTCLCNDETIAKVELGGVGRLCVDSIDRSNCTTFPRRCVKWCDGSQTSHCLCPSFTRKVRKINGIFDCELEPTGQCRFDDEQGVGLRIRKCPTGTYCDGDRCRPSMIADQTYPELLPEPFLPLTTASAPRLGSASKQSQRDQQTAIFIRTLICIAIAIVLFFVLIILIIVLLVKSNRFRASSKSSEDKVSSSSFAQSTSTALSMDLSTNAHNHYHQQLEQVPPSTSISPINSADSLQHYDNYLSKTAMVHGLVPQTVLSPRFHRQQQVLDERRRAPLQIRSPSLSRINPFIDHASLATTKERQANKRVSSPKVTRLQNGDVVISA